MSKEQNAFEAAVEIVIASLSDDNVTPNSRAGENVGDYFQTLYHKLLEVAPETD